MSTHSNNSTQSPDTQVDWLTVVKEKVAKLKYGSVQITVHEGKVTQVESIEKTRFLHKKESE